MYFNFSKQGHFKRSLLSQISLSSLFVNLMQECDRGYSPARSILCLHQIWVEADIELCKNVLHAPGPGCSMAFLWSLPSGRDFLIAAKKLSDNHLLGKLRQSYRINITGLNEWCRQTKKLLAWNRTCWFKLRFLLNSVPFLQQCSKLCNWEICISNS